MSAQLDRCWTQDPVIFQDALGRVTPLPLGFIDSWEVRLGLDSPFTCLANNQAFDAVLEVRFRQCPGHRKVVWKDYDLRSRFPTTRNQYASRHEFRRTQTEYAVIWSPYIEDFDRTVDFRKTFYTGRHGIMYMRFKPFRHVNSVCPGCQLRPPVSQDHWVKQIKWYSYQALSLA